LDYNKLGKFIYCGSKFCLSFVNLVNDSLVLLFSDFPLKLHGRSKLATRLTEISGKQFEFLDVCSFRNR
jgi:hypothetical protein